MPFCFIMESMMHYPKGSCLLFLTNLSSKRTMINSLQVYCLHLFDFLIILAGKISH
jgi:hypothetical protein